MEDVWVGNFRTNMGDIVWKEFLEALRIMKLKYHNALYLF